MKKNYLLLFFIILGMIRASCSSHDDDDKLSVKSTTLNFDKET